jgi:hypothetical protein
MKNIVLLVTIIVSLIQICVAKDLPIKNQDVSPAQLQKQNKKIAQLAAKQLSKNLPQVINKSTTIVSIKAVDTTLIYTYEIKSGAKSDDAIRAEDRTAWEKVFVKNVCERSKRFMDAQISLSYVYTSAISKEKLFQFDVDQQKCFKRFGMR